MHWIKDNIATLITLAVLLLTVTAAFARMQAVCTQIDGKADKEVVYRELDQIHRTLGRIESKVDGLGTSD